MNLPENKMSVLKRIGIPIVEHCNLKCKGCLHFCNSNQEEFYYDCEEFERDVMRLSELFDNIEVLILYGGEPLLHPKIIRLLEIVRVYLKKTKIEILTNGLLLPTLDENFYQSIKKYDVCIGWSAYPVGKKINMKIEDTLISEKVVYYKNDVQMFYGIFRIIKVL